jgi:hypothetical protein
LRRHRAGDLIWRPTFRITIDIITIFLPDHARDARFRPTAEPASEVAQPAFRTNETILGNPRNGAETKRA